MKKWYLNKYDLWASRLKAACNPTKKLGWLYCISFKPYTALIFSLFFITPAYALDLYIFKPTKEKATVVQDMIQKHCPDINVTVFGRVKDFIDQIESAKPSAIISLLPVVNQYNTYTILSKGALNGVTQEPYVFISIDKPIDPKNIEKMSLGVIDILGRKGMTSYIAELFGKKIEIKRVTKTEDLIPLLTFNAVDALLITKSVFDEIKSTSQLNFVETATELKIGLSTVATMNAEDQGKLKACVAKLPKDTNAILGVEKWTF